MRITVFFLAAILAIITQATPIPNDIKRIVAALDVDRHHEGVNDFLRNIGSGNQKELLKHLTKSGGLSEEAKIRAVLHETTLRGLIR